MSEGDCRRVKESRLESQGQSQGQPVGVKVERRGDVSKGGAVKAPCPGETRRMLSMEEVREGIMGEEMSVEVRRAMSAMLAKKTTRLYFGPKSAVENKVEKITHKVKELKKKTR